MRTADRVHTALMLDIWPDRPGALVDYNLDGPDAERNYRALHHAVRQEGVTADQLHQAFCDNTLEKLIRDHNPDKEVRFPSIWDDYGSDAA